MTHWNIRLVQWVLVDNQVETLLAKHVVLTLLALVIGVVLVKCLATIVAEEPVVLKVGILIFLILLLVHLLLLHVHHAVLLLLLIQLIQYPYPQLLLLPLRLLPNHLLLLLLPLLNLLSLVLSRLRLYPHRLLNLSRILHNLITIRLLIAEVINRLVLVHLHASLLVLLVDLLELVAY